MEEPAARLELLKSEAAVLAAASRIYAAGITSRQVTPENESEMAEKAIRIAIAMAQRVDVLVSSDEELRSPLGGGTFAGY